MSVVVDYELAGDLKIGQVGIANLRIRTLDVPRLVDEMRGRVQRAPKLFARAAVVIDFGGLTQAPDVGTARELLTGLQMFRGKSLLELHQSVLSQEIESPEKIQLELPPEVGVALMKALQRKPEDRYKSADLFARALRRAAAQADVDLASNAEIVAFVVGSSYCVSQAPPAPSPPQSASVTFIA